MAWVGEMLVEGLAGSLDSNGKRAVQSAKRLANDVSGVMRNLSADMAAAIPSHIDVNASVRSLSAPTPASHGQAFNVTIPLTIDGTVLARILAEIQWTQNAVYVRNLGMA